MNLNIVGHEEPTEFVLEGVERLEDAPADDVATFIHHVVRIVARAAGHAVGREVKSTGRYEAIVAAASRVRIQSIRSGSVAIAFLPSRHDVIPLGDNLGLDAESVSEAALGIAAQAAGDRAVQYPDVARAWAELGDAIGIGKRYERVVVSPPGQPRIVVDEQALKRLADVARSKVRTGQEETVRGVLYEANFETFTARLRTQQNDAIDVSFAADLADEIKEALRNPATLVGEVVFDPRVNRAISVTVRRVERPFQLGLEDFWSHKTVAELMAEQRVEAITDTEQLVADAISEEDWASFREVLGIEI